MMFGNGAICQVVLGGSTKVVSAPKGDWLSLNTGWAVGGSHPPPAIPVVVADTGLFVAGGAVGAWICGGISGGHINPVVRDLP